MLHRAHQAWQSPVVRRRVKWATAILVALNLIAWPIASYFITKPDEVRAATLTYVGGLVNSRAGSTGTSLALSLTALTGGISSAAAAGDLVIATCATGSVADRSIGISTPAGYTELQELYSNSTTDTSLSVNWKIMGSTPDTSVSCGPSGSTADAITGSVHVWRNIDPDNPFDVTETTATGTGTGRANPAPITPSTPGAIVLGIGAGAAATGAVYTSSDLSNFITRTSADTYDSFQGIGSYSWSSGTFDPAQFGGGTTGTGDSWAAVTLALKPRVDITVGTTGAQTANINIPSSNQYVGGSFTFIRDSGSANITQIIISDTGTVNASTNLSNLDLYYETAGTCTYDGTETLFGTAASFSSEAATVTGTMAVGTSQVCVYAVVDVGSGASDGETLEVEITDPSTHITVSDGYVAPSVPVDISGTTTLTMPNSSPVLNIDLPAIDTDIAEISNYTIQYDLSDADAGDTATVDFYYETDGNGAGGTAITACQNQAEGTNATCQFTPSSEGMALSTYYYIYGIASDSVNPDVLDVSSGRLRRNAAPTLTITDPDAAGDTVTQGQTYTIYFTLSDTDSVVTVDLYYDTDGSGLNGTAIAVCQNLSEATASCGWDTTGVSADTYYIYGRDVNDGINTEVTDYSPGEVTIQSINAAPNNPTSLDQMKTDNTDIPTGGWINETSVKFTAAASDTDNPDTLYLCIEKDALGTAFSNTEDLCGSGVAYSGSPVSVTVTITGITDATEYHWQARVKDAAGAYSSWVSHDTNLESERDFGIDTTSPTGGTVKDGAGADQDYNDGSLTQIAGNWTSTEPDPAASGLLRYDYAIRREADGYYWNVCTDSGGTWQSGENWCNNATSTSFTRNGMNLATGVNYYITLKAYDNAGNMATLSSDGQQVQPTLSFSISSSSVTFADLNNLNNWTDNEQTVVTTSTNASSGYTVTAYINSLLTSTAYPAQTIANFIGDNAPPASWADPDPWADICDNGSQYCGFGYTSSDNLVQGSDRFNGATEFAPYLTTGPGNVVADHTAAVNGSTGAISNEQFTITHRVSVAPSQAASIYQTLLTLIVTANF